MFKFRLAKLLSLKEKMEEQKKNEFAQANAKLNAEKERKNMLISEQKKLILEMKDNVANVKNIKQNNEYNKYIDYLKEVIKKVDLNIEKLTREVEKKRKELTEAVKERKILENYKEKEKEKYRKEENKIAEGLTNELTSYKYSSIDEEV